MSEAHEHEDEEPSLTDHEISEFFRLKDKIGAVMESRGSLISYVSGQETIRPWAVPFGGNFFSANLHDDVPHDDKGYYEDDYGFGEAHLILAYPKMMKSPPDQLDMNKVRHFMVTVRHLTCALEDLVEEYHQKANTPQGQADKAYEEMRLAVAEDQAVAGGALDYLM